ncbi:MAG: restriction endonuclease [Caldilinea sp.]
MPRVIPLSALPTADLLVDAVYEGGIAGNTGDDPLSKLLRCGNQGGFRRVGSPAARYVVLYSSQEDPDWPDGLDISTGLFVYYGDNKKPGHALHDTPRRGNDLLRFVYDCLHDTPPRRAEIPPFFVFTKYITASKRSVQFRGLAVPGGLGIAPTDDLVALWKSVQGQRFQNYRAVFTVLDVPTASRAWLDDLYAGVPLSRHAPQAWRRWVQTGAYTPLRAQPTLHYRTVAEQMPQAPAEQAIVATLYAYFQDTPTAFEACAARLASMMDDHILIDELTRPTADGGRDAIGRYRVGPYSDPVAMEFALEAKCYSPGVAGLPLNAVGVKETARLISRLRHRQFGILVTTSVVGKQAYEEIRQDRHPVVILCGRDLAVILMEKGLNSAERVRAWLEAEFPG